MVVTNEINEKIQSYVVKLKETEEKEDFDSTVQVITEYQAYVNGLLSQETNETYKTYFLGILSGLNILRRLIKLSKNVKEKNQEFGSNLNSLTERLLKLEKKLDDWIENR